MKNRFPGKDCVLGPEPSFGGGEHVWSRALLGDFDGEGDFHVFKSGVPYRKKADDSVVAFKGLPGVRVPMCRTHNDGLNQLVEVPAIPVLRRIPRSAEEAWPRLSPIEAAALGRWLLKVGLLLAHPDAEHDSPHVQRDKTLKIREPVFRAEWISWMAVPEDPSNDFSVFVNRREVVRSSGEATAGDEPDDRWAAEVVLPGHVTVDSRSLYFMSRGLGVRDLQATVVFHPGWPVRHPLVEVGRAAVLWPPPAEPVDLDRLEPVGEREFRFVGDPGSYGTSEAEYSEITQTPLGVGVVPLNVFTARFRE